MSNQAFISGTGFQSVNAVESVGDNASGEVVEDKSANTTSRPTVAERVTRMWPYPINGSSE